MFCLAFLALVAAVLAEVPIKPPDIPIEPVKVTNRCFPASATVLLESGATKTMAELQVGDRVLVDKGIYSDVYMFTHRYSEFEGPFVAITTESGENIMLTHDHYIYVNGSLAVAGSVAVGDIVITKDGEAVVKSVATERAKGLYNPITMDGNIVVNGIKTSSYTSIIVPSLAHSLLWPARMLYSLGIDLLEGVFDEGSETIASILPHGARRY